MRRIDGSLDVIEDIPNPAGAVSLGRDDRIACLSNFVPEERKIGCQEAVGIIQAQAPEAALQTPPVNKAG